MKSPNFRKSGGLRQTRSDLLKRKIKKRPLASAGILKNSTGLRWTISADSGGIGQNNDFQENWVYSCRLAGGRLLFRQVIFFCLRPPESAQAPADKMLFRQSPGRTFLRRSRRIPPDATWIHVDSGGFWRNGDFACAIYAIVVARYFTYYSTLINARLYNMSRFPILCV